MKNEEEEGRVCHVLAVHREPQARAARPKNSISSQLQIGLSITRPPRLLLLRILPFYCISFIALLRLRCLLVGKCLRILIPYDLYVS